MLEFDTSHHLTPYQAIPSNISELEEIFVKDYSSVKRSKLFDMYLRYINDLKHLCGDVELKHWVDGSFATRRKPSPNDIDLVVFIESSLLATLGESLTRFVYPHSKVNYPGIDAYVVEEKNSSSDQYFIFQSDQSYWTNQFTKSRRNKAGKKLSKGFLEIKY